MTAQTPVKLTTHRGPLATPPSSPESSIRFSTPSNITSSQIRPARPTVDVAITPPRTSVLSPLTYYRTQSHPRRQWRRGVVNERVLQVSGLGPRLSIRNLELIFESLIHWACDLAKALIGVVIFCLLTWALLESASLVCGPSPPPNSRWLSIPHLPLPSPTRSLRCHLNPYLCGPQETDVAVLQFLSDQIQHAKNLASFSVGLGLPLRAFFEAHQTSVGTFVARHQLPGLSRFMRDADTLTNLTETLDLPFVDFTPSSFIGKSFSLALDEVGGIISDPLVSHHALKRKEYREAHSHAICWRTASNLLLEYSAARPRTRELLQHIQTIHRELSPLVPILGDAVRVEGESNIWWKSKAYARASTEEDVRAFVAGLEVTMENLRRLAAYLDWITVHLAQTTLTDILKTHRKADFSSCMTALQELFARSKTPTPKKSCFCLDDYKIVPSSGPERLDITVPGSPTVQVGW
ncbi:hypothetical protein BS17DRAFT_773854 [Gyrodon lividus]|nr:hypothetical protein BS17DRAFT_773854 [Gyrodon lividus]